ANTILIPVEVYLYSKIRNPTMIFIMVFKQDIYTKNLRV
ncbi:MAG: hypothetical protein ACI9DK_000919, partial [Vicingaceae bacterium]